MLRNLDMTALRSFVTVADMGGVTKAASVLNLTQSAVSMQIKRLEEMIGVALLQRSGRGVELTSGGEQLLSYSRRIIALNDEAWNRLTNDAFEGELNIGVPHDIIYPHIPAVMQRFAAAYPRVNVRLHSSYTAKLKDQFAAGELDLTLTTEMDAHPDAEVLSRRPLVWTGAPGGTAWRERPLKLGFEAGCIFRKSAIEALDAADIPWDLIVESDDGRALEASVAADFVVHVMLEGAASPYMEVIAHGGHLPALPTYHTLMFIKMGANQLLSEEFARSLRIAYGNCDAVAAE